MKHYTISCHECGRVISRCSCHGPKEKAESICMDCERKLWAKSAGEAYGKKWQEADKNFLEFLKNDS